MTWILLQLYEMKMITLYKLKMITSIWNMITFIWNMIAFIWNEDDYIYMKWIWLHDLYVMNMITFMPGNIE